MCVICTKCGGTNVACEAMINPNGNVFKNFTDEAFAYGFCDDCKTGVMLSDVDDVKNQMDCLYKEYLKLHKHEPMFASCEIVWKEYDSPQLSENMIIKLSTEIIESQDEIIFFYCNGIDELKSLADFTGEDFTIVDIYNFIEI